MKNRCSHIKLLLFLFFCHSLWGQDLILTKGTKIIRAEVTDANDIEVSYLQTNNGQQTEGKVSTSDVILIRFKDETKWKSLPDGLVIGKIDDLYGKYLQALSSGPADDAIRILQDYYSGLPQAQRERVKQKLIDRLSSDYNSNNDLIVYRIKELLTVLPMSEPGRDVLLRVAASVYKSYLDLDSLNQIMDEFVAYENYHNRRFPKSEEAIRAAIDYVIDVNEFGNQLVGLWISEEKEGPYGGPKYALRINKSIGDSLSIRFIRGLDSIDFDYDSENCTYAQAYALNGVRKEYSFTFSSKRFKKGNSALAEGALILGSSVSSTIAQMSAEKSDSPLFYNPNTSLSTLFIAGLAGMIAQSKTTIEVLKLYGKRDHSGWFVSNLNLERIELNGGAPERTLLEELPIRLMRIPSESDICFFDKDGYLFGFDSVGWTKNRQEQWWAEFIRTEDYDDLVRQFGSEGKKMSKKKIKEAYNERSYQRIKQVIDE